MSIFKSFRSREGMKLEIEGRAFNIGNTPWFGFGDNSVDTTTTVTNGAFGQD